MGLFKVATMPQSDIVLYFAYGSNMSTKRLRERIPNAQPIGAAALNDYEFSCNKKSKDSSSKGNISPRKNATTWGVLFEIPLDDLKRLDEIEGGYERIAINVLRGNQSIESVTYISQRISTAPPYDWYMNYIIEGAREHGLPDDYIQSLSRITAKTGN